ncbi:MAG TPA: cation diffusion facilitator family transporter [Clostridia bacterium]|nr:cation diffusion facilitator family transporter [Clostridia bacterium]
MKTLKKLFIKDYKNVEKQEVRLRYGMVAGIFGMITNALLCLAKMTIGFIGNSVTIIADAVNNLSDVGSSAVTAIGFKLSSKPADKEHPYGHARYEYLTALIVALIVLIIGVLLGKSSIEKIISNEKTTVSIYTFIVLGVSMLVKLWQMLVYRNFGLAIKSDVLKATSIDSRNDIISTGVVLISSVIIWIVGDIKVSIDGLFGVGVSLFVIISAIMLIKDTINPIIGEKPDPELVNTIKEMLLSYEGVIGIHDLMIHNYGTRGNCFVLVHIEVPANEDIMKSHDMIDNIERDFMEKMGMHLSVHMDPIQEDNKVVQEHKERAVTLLCKINPVLSMHDFRMVVGETHTNILFDVVVPYCEKTTQKELEDAFIAEYENEEKQYFFIISVDRTYL